MLKKLLLITLLCFSTLIAKEEILIPTDDWPPFRMTNENIYSGIDFDLLEELSKRLNMQTNFRHYPWARSLANMKNGTVDMITGIALKKERQEYIKYSSIPYYSCSPVFYTQKGLGQNIKTYNDLKKYLVGYVNNSAYFKQFDNDKTLQKRAVTNEQQLLKMLALKRMKVIIGTDCQADFEIAKLGLQNQVEKTSYRPEKRIDLYVGISRKSTLINKMDEINSVLKNIIDEGKVKEFASKYYGND